MSSNKKYALDTAQITRRLKENITIEKQFQENTFVFIFTSRAKTWYILNNFWRNK